MAVINAPVVRTRSAWELEKAEGREASARALINALRALSKRYATLVAP